jgi:hypothetical protein
MLLYRAVIRASLSVSYRFAIPKVTRSPGWIPGFAPIQLPTPPEGTFDLTDRTTSARSVIPLLILSKCRGEPESLFRPRSCAYIFLDPCLRLARTTPYRFPSHFRHGSCVIYRLNEAFVLPDSLILSLQADCLASSSRPASVEQIATKFDDIRWLTTVISVHICFLLHDLPTIAFQLLAWQVCSVSVHYFEADSL